MMGDMPDGMANLLARKYAILQQHADAGTLNAQTGAASGASDVAMNALRMRLMPGESAAGVSKTRAETGLIGQQAQYYGQEAVARIAGINAETGLTTTNNRIAIRENLTPNSQKFGTSPGRTLEALSGVMGSPYRLSGVGTPINKPRALWTAEDLDRHNGGD